MILYDQSKELAFEDNAYQPEPCVVRRASLGDMVVARKEACHEAKCSIRHLSDKSTPPSRYQSTYSG